MDPKDLPLDRLEAGRRYLSAIEKLGLRPSALFWAWDRTIEAFVLVLVSHAFDFAGPLALSRTLIDAYNRAGTPREIDPFILRLHSPKQQIVKEIGKFFPFESELIGVTDADGKPIPGVERARVASLQLDAADLEIHSDWVLRFEAAGKKASAVEMSRGWRRFVSNIDRLAA